MTRVLRDAVYRFVMTQLLILVGLILIIGPSSYQGHWLWVLLGSVAVVKGLFFLSAPERGRAALLQWWDRTPVWAHRASGVLMVAFAVLLALETIRTVS
jgi:threonine/homoserine/homoserine lactone efflux protein